MNNKTKAWYKELDEYVVPDYAKKEYDRLSKVLSEEQMRVYKSGIMGREMYNERVAKGEFKMRKRYYHKKTE